MPSLLKKILVSLFAFAFLLNAQTTSDSLDQFVDIVFKSGTKVEGKLIRQTDSTIVFDADGFSNYQVSKSDISKFHVYSRGQNVVQYGLGNTAFYLFFLVAIRFSALDLNFKYQKVFNKYCTATAEVEYIRFMGMSTGDAIMFSPGIRITPFGEGADGLYGAIAPEGRYFSSTNAITIGGNMTVGYQCQFKNGIVVSTSIGPGYMFGSGSFIKLNLLDIGYSW